MDEASRIVAGEAPSARIGLRLAAWYAIVFVITSLAIVLLTYRLLEASLIERDRQLVSSTLREYSERYAAGGLSSLADAVEIEQRSGRQERLFVRVVRGRSETLFLSAPYAWNDFDVSRLTGIDGLEQILSDSGTTRLEVASAQLADGTLLQVGKSSESREALLARYRTVLVCDGIGPEEARGYGFADATPDFGAALRRELDERGPGATVATIINHGIAWRMMPWREG